MNISLQSLMSAVREKFPDAQRALLQSTSPRRGEGEILAGATVVREKN